MKEYQLKHLPTKHVHLPVVDSTNTYLKNRLTANQPVYVLSCDYQRQGRGRLNRRWLATPNESLLCTIPFVHTIDWLPAPAYTLLAGLCLHQVVYEMTDVQAALKWPNDLIVQDKKLAGILCESLWQKKGENQKLWVLVGIGLNLKQDNFPPEVVAKAISLKQLTGKKLDFRLVISSILTKLDSYIELLGDKYSGQENWRNIRQEWETKSNSLGKYVSFPASAARNLAKGGLLTGRILGLDEQAGLRVALEDNQVATITTDEVYFLSPNTTN